MAKWTRQAVKDMKRIPRPQAQLIKEKVAQLETNPEAQANNIKWIDTASLYRLRVNNYRVFFDKENQIVSIYYVKNRQAAYNK